MTKAETISYLEEAMQDLKALIKGLKEDAEPKDLQSFVDGVRFGLQDAEEFWSPATRI